MAGTEKSEDRLKAELCFSRIPWLGPAHARSLMERFGSPEELLKADRQALFRVPGMNRRLAGSILQAPSPDRYAQEANELLERGIRTWSIGEPGYPSRLSMCPDAPVLIYGKGELDLERERMISIVGTRSITPYGKEVCRELVAGLASLDVGIVSGLAYGVDIRAHRAALSEGLPTIAVAGHGPDRVYPVDHAPDLKEMMDNGGILTEFPLGSTPDRHHFPRRNRIIAGLTDCTVVVETGEKGGAMITADIAHSYERDVLVFPGRANDISSAGCNRLIKEHKGALIEGVNDLLHQMHWEEADQASEDHQRKLFLEDLSEEEQSIALAVDRKERISIDGLAAELEWPIGKLSPLLLDLELKGVLSSLPGKIYVRADR